MEVLASVVGAIVGALLPKSCEHLCGCVIKAQSIHVAMKSEMERLKNRREEVDVDRRRQAEGRGQEIRADVVTWLENVDKLDQKVNLIPVPPQFSLNCCKWYRANREVTKILKEITRLLDAGSFDAGVIDPSPTAVEHIPDGPSIQCQTTASKTLAKTMNLLYDDKYGVIGIWGLGGVGKTTLVKNLNNELESSSKQPFGIVIWATVSKTFEIRQVQSQIAQRMNLKVNTNESEERMALRLHQRLMNVEKFLLILDDVWDKIDLEELGVPQPKAHKNCKIILTTRRMEVCRSMLTDFEFKIDVLNDEEAWQLFCQKAGDVDHLEEIKPIAKAIVRECGGLPLAIIVVGAAMRRKTKVALWKHALKQLQRSVPSIQDIEDKVYKPLRLSYDSLQDINNIKSCFLYCSLYPEDHSIPIYELQLCWQAEGLIVEENYFDAKNTVIALIEKLKDSCLLEDGVADGTVKMHDVVRDVAIWIGSPTEDGCKSLVRSGIGLSGISVGEFSNSISLKRVSFMHNKITRLPDCVIQCPEASTLLLQDNELLQTVPERFLQGFVALKVLSLSKTDIQSLPVSLEKLSRLEMLDLSGTLITELSQEMEKMSNLRHLDLSHTVKLKTIPAGIISKLSCLEVLDMTDSTYELLFKREEGKITFEQLRYRDQLLISSIRLKMIPHLNSGDLSWINRLKGFQISFDPKTTVDKSVIYGHADFSQVDFSQESIKELWDVAESLVLNDRRGPRGLDEMLEDLVKSGRGFTGLKSLTITGFKPFDRRVRVYEGLAAECDLLPNLEELTLSRLNVLESISELAGYLGLRFPRLKSIEVSDCSDMKYLLSCGDFIQTLPDLKIIKVSSCKNLYELFIYDSRSNMAQGTVVPNLRILELNGLPNLRTLCRREEKWPCLQQVEVLAAECDLLPNLEELTLSRLNVLESISELVGYLGLRFPTLKSIEVSDCSDMKYLLSCGDFIQTLPELKIIKVSSCKNLDELFNFDTRSNMAQGSVVPNLRILELNGLPNLRTLCRPKETWPCLEQVEVLKCKSLKRLPLNNQNVGVVKEIKGESEWWDALEWDDDETKSSLLSCFRRALP